MRAALVTGASSGLGRAVALELGRSGVTTLLMARDEARIGEVASEIGRARGEAVACPADVRDLAAVHAALGRALGARPLELVVHAAGVLELGPVDELDDGQFARCFDVNVLGTSHVVQAALPRLAACGGRLIIVVSVAGLFALPGGFAAYAASKWALRGYAETVRDELRARGVGLTVAYPSILDTPMVQALGPSAPAVYRAFPWHAADRVARAILRDARRGRKESYATLSDRLAARAAAVAPHAFAAGMRAPGSTARAAENEARVHPVAFRLGSFELPAYGLLMAAGALVGALLFAFLARRAGFERARAFEVAIESVLVAMLAAKAAGAWVGGVRSITAFVGTGGIWYAGLVVGAAFFAWRSRALGATVLQAFDLAAPGVALGHAVGRLGCLLAGCCWGKPSQLPWAITFTDRRAHELTGVPLDVPLHPVQVYEAIGEALLACVLAAFVLSGRRRFDGMAALLYLAGYGLLRLGLEALRDDPRGGIGPLSTSQAAAAWVVIGAAVAFVLLRRRSIRR